MLLEILDRMSMASPLISVREQTYSPSPVRIKSIIQEYSKLTT